VSKGSLDWKCRSQSYATARVDSNGSLLGRLNTAEESGIRYAWFALDLPTEGGQDN